jgi:hypothetical protein
MHIQRGRFVSCFAALMLFSAVAFGQMDDGFGQMDEDEAPPQGVTIVGTVLEEGNSVPVAEAYVTLLAAPSRDYIDSGFVDESGRFALTATKPGHYVIRATAQGFVDAFQPDSGPGINIDEASIETGGTPFAVTITLRRLGAIKGRIQDRETEKPVPSIGIQALRMDWFRGQRAFAREGSRVQTDESGRFSLERLPAGEYFLEIVPPAGGTSRGRVFKFVVSTVQTPDGELAVSMIPMETEAPEEPKPEPSRALEPYPLVFWPSDPEAGAPVDLSKGGLADANVIGISRTKQVLLQGNLKCTDEWVESVGVARVLGVTPLSVNSTGACGSFAIPVMPSGRYRVLLTRLNLRWAQIKAASAAEVIAYTQERMAVGAENVFVGADGDLTIDLEPRQVPTIAGYITCDCRNPAQPAGAIRRISLVGLDGSEVAYFDVGEDGSFRGMAPIQDFDNVALDRLLEVKLPANGLYVKKIVLDGVETGPTLQFELGPPTHSLEIVLSDRPALVSGKVSRDGKPAAGQKVVLATWPALAADGFPYYRSASVAPDGSFSLTDLAPGAYRAVSIGPETWRLVQMPAVLSSLLASNGVDLTLAESESRTIALEAE